MSNMCKPRGKLGFLVRPKMINKLKFWARLTMSNTWAEND